MATTQPARTTKEVSFSVERGLAPGIEKIHGVHPIFLVEKIIRERILDSMYYKKHCFNLNLLTFIEKASSIQLVGTYSNSNNTRPSHFICLLFKLLQLQPSRDILMYFIRQTHFKYLTALAIVYVRLTFDSKEVYETLEPLLNDYRKLRFRNPYTQSIELGYIDKLVENLLDDESNKFFDLTLPRLTSRIQLEDQNILEYRVSPLEDELDEAEEQNAL